MRQILFRPEAETDLLEIALYVAQDSPSRAQALVARLRRRVSHLKTAPLAGRPRPELGDEVRSLSERPYVILYRVAGEDVEVIAFLHGARDLPSALANRIARRD